MSTSPLSLAAAGLSSSILWRAMISIAVMTTCHAAAAYDNRLDDVMYQDPGFPEATTRIEFSDRLKPLWLQALARPESELQRMAADTIAMARRSGMTGLDDTADQLVAILEQENLEPTVRRAVVNAIVTLDARHAAKPLAQSIGTGSLEIANIVEPALARWDYEPARTIWRQRMADPETERSRLQLAFRCLGIVKDTDALSKLLQIVKDANAEVPVRLSAARASAEINHSDLVTAAIELASAKDGRLTTSLLAATLLTKQTSSEAVSILTQLAAVDSVTICGLALRRLFEIDPRHVYEFTESAIRSTDVNVRRVACEAFVHQADVDSITQLSQSLDDANPGLRHYTSRSLIQFADQASLRESVIQGTTNVVSQDAWRGLEQGIIVLATLDHEPAVPRMIELLSHRRPEVAVTAAWGLRKLAVLEALPAMLAQAERQTTHIIDGTLEVRYKDATDSQLSHLFQAFGELGHQEAESLMRKFIPKKLMPFVAARPAAVWALGKLNEGKTDEALAQLLAERLADVNFMDPELEPVRHMSALGIGRMNAESQLATLRKFVIEAPMPGQACAWSIERITGEVHEFSLERVIKTGDWFLSPTYGNRADDTD